MPDNGGTKPVLATRLTNELQTPLLRKLPSNTPHRILSIDMGIRNLALCLVRIHSSKLPQITNWNRVTVTQKPTLDDSSPSESFEPIEYAEKAYKIIKSSLETYKPHTILIERQRYRSAGSSAVQEWTVRVNMLESMFHAILYTMKMEHKWEFDVFSVSPRKVTQLWLADVDEKMNARETKVAKIAAAAKVLEGDVEIIGQARETAEEFGRKRGGIKVDDLADSMLQGLGWWRWHVNRMEMVEEILGWEDIEKKTKPKKAKVTKEKKIGERKSGRKTSKAKEVPDNSVQDEVAQIPSVAVDVANDVAMITKSRRRKTKDPEVPKPRRKRPAVKLLEI